MAKKLALLIGNSQYDDEKFTELRASEKDIEGLESALLNPDIAGFDQVKSLLNQTQRLVEKAIAELFSNNHKDDLILLYFSGHGQLDSEGDLYCALKQSEFQLPIGTAISATYLLSVIKKSTSNRKILILDCCYSGAIGKGIKGVGVPAITKDMFDVSGYGLYFLSSSSAIQPSVVGKLAGVKTDRSLFTHYLIEGLETGKAAINGEKEITIEQLYQFTHEQVVNKKAEMEPQKWSDKQKGALVIAKNPSPEIKTTQGWMYNRQSALNIAKNRLSKFIPKELPVDLINALSDENPYARKGALGEGIQPWINSDDKTEALAAEIVLIELEDQERNTEVRKIVNELLKKANSQKYKIKILGEFLPSVGHTGTSVFVKNKETQSLTPGTVFQDTLKDGLLGPKMVVIPAGEFLMGSPENEEGRYENENEGPQHKVTIQDQFAMGIYTVTKAEFQTFVSQTSYKTEAETDGGSYCWDGGRLLLNPDRNWRDPGFSQSDQHAVTCISWNDAKAYINWLNINGKYKYRLPSEAEWEYAARANSITAFCFGDNISPDIANYIDVGSLYKKIVFNIFGIRISEVGHFSANAFGLYDVHGNVLEWVEDCYHENYKDAPKDGTVWDSGECIYRVLRGGAWTSDPQFLRSAFRFGFEPSYRFNLMGFRLAREL